MRLDLSIEIQAHVSKLLIIFLVEARMLFLVIGNMITLYRLFFFMPAIKIILIFRMRLALALLHTLGIL